MILFIMLKNFNFRKPFPLINFDQNKNTDSNKQFRKI